MVSKRRLVITAVLQEYPSPRSATYGVAQGWINRLMARYQDEGQSAVEPRSPAPKTHPRATPDAEVELVQVMRCFRSTRSEGFEPPTF